MLLTVNSDPNPDSDPETDALFMLEERYGGEHQNKRLWNNRSPVGHQEVSRCCTIGESQGTCNTHIPPPSVNKSARSSFETQRRRHQKSKTRVSVAPQKGLISSKNL